MSQEFKADDNKLKPSLIFDGMPDALQYLFAVATYGAEKYEPHSWKRVDVDRYIDAKWRHAVSSGNDDESGLPHLAHELWGCLAILQSKIDSGEIAKFSGFNAPPVAHKMVNDWCCDEDKVPYIVREDAPDWANWVAKDKDGRFYWYHDKPILEDEVWTANLFLRFFSNKMDGYVSDEKFEDSLRRVYRSQEEADKANGKSAG